MLNISDCGDLEKAQKLWQRHWPQKCLFDLWPVRACFQSQYKHTPHFIVATDNGQFRGMLALSWIDEEQYFGHFPGELWQGKTWLEQNKLLASDQEVLNALLDHTPSEVRIRYLGADSILAAEPSVTVDEIGYLFYPPQYGYSFQEYLQSFSGKSRKKIRRELDLLKTGGVSYRYDRLTDIEIMFRLNIENFKGQSYFDEPRFLRSFENLIAWLHQNNLLRVTTVLLGGKVAAVDIGAVWNATYVVLAGATHTDFPGVAKLINLHHIEWSCDRRLSAVDFLCGDFNWKNRFHLTPRPLYKFSKRPALEDRPEGVYDRRTACAG
jgi:hypothetical protein